MLIITKNSHAADCEIFLDLRMASTFRAPAATIDLPVAGAALLVPLTIPMADGALRQQVYSWLVHDLPAFAIPPVTKPMGNQLP